MSKLKLYKPTTPSRRHSSVVNYKEILTTSEPYKKLTIRKKTNAGRSNGRITVRHQGGGSRNLVRIINYKRQFEEGFKINTIEYDPNRTAFICLVSCLKTGKKSYVLHTKGMEVGKIMQTDNALENGNQVKLSSVPVGSEVCQIELYPGAGSTIIRSAGSYGIVTAKEEKYITIKLPSGEIRKFLGTCKCVLSRMGNEAHGLVRIGKAGRVRHKGIRPTVRGKVMNPVDHPHGGGEARNSIGMPYPKTPWGKHALGVKTRDKKKQSARLIVKRKNGRKY